MAKLDYLPGIDDETMERLEYVRSCILLGIGEDDTLHSLYFCNCNAGGYQVCGLHSDSSQFAHVNITLAYDLSNAEEVINKFVDEWKSEREVSRAAFYREGKKYGWD